MIKQLLVIIAAPLIWVLRLPKRALDARSKFRKQGRCTVATSARLRPRCRILNGQNARPKIVVGDVSIIDGELFIFGYGGKIEIGANTFVGEDVRIWSSNAIKIGDRVLISHRVNIHDANSHPISAQARHRHFTAIAEGGHPKDFIGIKDTPIVIEDELGLVSDQLY